MTYLQERQVAGEIVTGLLYLHPRPQDLHGRLDTLQELRTPPAPPRSAGAAPPHPVDRAVAGGVAAPRRTPPPPPPGWLCPVPTIGGCGRARRSATFFPWRDRMWRLFACLWIALIDPVAAEAPPRRRRGRKPSRKPYAV